MGKRNQREISETEFNRRVKDYKNAFEELWDRLHESKKEMLKKHFKMKGQTVSTRDLADAAGYVNYNAANLNYGILGCQVQECLKYPVKTDHTGSGKGISVLAYDTKERDEDGYCQWTMHKWVKKALDESGLL